MFQRISHLLTRRKTRLNGYVYEFSVDYNIIETSNIIDIHKYLMKKKCQKVMLGIINYFWYSYLAYLMLLAIKKVYR